MKTKIFHLQNLTALHVGTGQGVGVVDLPIARSKATNLPIVPGSGLKGVLRSFLTPEGDTAKEGEMDKKDIQTLFGPDNQLEEAHAGAIAFGDAQLLLLPIRSFAGTVAYATCGYILRQYKRDMATELNVPNITDNTARITQDSKLMITANTVALEDLDIESHQTQLTDDWATLITNNLYPDSVMDATQWRDEIAKRFILLPDDIFSFLADTATEIRTRIRIDQETRVVQAGALWTEENLPAETVLWGVIGITQSRDKNQKRTAQELADLLPHQEMRLQIGGKHTVGRGFCRLLISDLLVQGGK